MSDREETPVPNPIATMLAQRSEESWQLLDWLNRPDSDVAALVIEMQRMETVASKLAPALRSRKARKIIGRILFNQQDAVLGGITNKKVKERYAQFHASEQAVNAKLAAYASYPILFYDIRAGQWGSTHSAEEKYPREWFAITYMVKLILSGRLQRIRRCLNCHCWFLARTATQDCCDTRCRKKYRSQDPKFKAGRVEYMRGYRKRQNDRDLANLKAS
jgi:hypothetical protein